LLFFIIFIHFLTFDNFFDKICQKMAHIMQLTWQNYHTKSVKAADFVKKQDLQLRSKISC
ncbi:MAG: hypothetical protein LUD48_05770, partial [Prevotella sp.]|nr:hypothetical protein [Prevotella sp.]